MEPNLNQPPQTPPPQFSAPQPQQPLPPPRSGFNWSSIFGVNMIIFLVYYMIAYMLVAENEEFMLLLGAYILHVIILGAFSIVRYFQGSYKNSAVLAFTAFTLAIIGFGACALPFFNGTVNF